MWLCAGGVWGERVGAQAFATDDPHGRSLRAVPGRASACARRLCGTKGVRFWILCGRRPFLRRQRAHLVEHGLLQVFADGALLAQGRVDLHGVALLSDAGDEARVHPPPLVGHLAVLDEDEPRVHEAHEDFCLRSPQRVGPPVAAHDHDADVGCGEGRLHYLLRVYPTPPDGADSEEHAASIRDVRTHLFYNEIAIMSTFQSLCIQTRGDKHN
jgi:hypothetical protein